MRLNLPRPGRHPTRRVTGWNTVGLGQPRAADKADNETLVLVNPCQPQQHNGDALILIAR